MEAKKVFVFIVSCFFSDFYSSQTINSTFFHIKSPQNGVLTSFSSQNVTSFVKPKFSSFPTRKNTSSKKFQVSSTSFNVTSSFSSLLTSFSSVTSSFSTFFGEKADFSLCPDQIVLKDVKAGMTRRVRVARTDHVDVFVSSVDGSCVSGLVGPGNDTNAMVGMIINERSVGNLIRVATSSFFVRIFKSTGSGTNIKLTIQCSKIIVPAIIGDVITTTFVPMENDLTLDVCLLPLDNSSLLQFFSANNSLKAEVELKAKNALIRLLRGRKCWNSSNFEDESNFVEVHAIRPFFVDAISDSRFKVCFALIFTSKFRTNSCVLTWKDAKYALDDVTGLENDEVRIVLAGRETNHLKNLMLGIAITGIFFLFFFWIWFYQKNHENKRPSKKKEEKETKLNVNVWPPIMQNPLYRSSILSVRSSINHRFQSDDEDEEDDEVFTRSSLTICHPQKPEEEEKGIKNEGFLLETKTINQSSIEMNRKFSSSSSSSSGIKKSTTNAVHFNPNVVQFQIDDDETRL